MQDRWCWISKVYLPIKTLFYLHSQRVGHKNTSCALICCRRFCPCIHYKLHTNIWDISDGDLKVTFCWEGVLTKSFKGVKPTAQNIRDLDGQKKPLRCSYDPENLTIWLDDNLNTAILAAPLHTWKMLPCLLWRQGATVQRGSVTCSRSPLEFSQGTMTGKPFSQPPAL